MNEHKHSCEIKGLWFTSLHAIEETRDYPTYDPRRKWRSSYISLSVNNLFAFFSKSHGCPATGSGSSWECLSFTSAFKGSIVSRGETLVYSKCLLRTLNTNPSSFSASNSAQAPKLMLRYEENIFSNMSRTHSLNTFSPIIPIIRHRMAHPQKYTSFRQCKHLKSSRT